MPDPVRQTDPRQCPACGDLTGTDRVCRSCRRRAEPELPGARGGETVSGLEPRLPLPRIEQVRLATVGVMPFPVEVEVGRDWLMPSMMGPPHGPPFVVRVGLRGYGKRFSNKWLVEDTERSAEDAVFRAKYANVGFRMAVREGNEERFPHRLDRDVWLSAEWVTDADYLYDRMGWPGFPPPAGYRVRCDCTKRPAVLLPPGPIPRWVDHVPVVDLHCRRWVDYAGKDRTALIGQCSECRKVWWAEA